MIGRINKTERTILERTIQEVMETVLPEKQLQVDIWVTRDPKYLAEDFSWEVKYLGSNKDKCKHYRKF